ncbi:hypothetical protein QBC38DRAFT_466500 [Podospora fimiseda]|uniref:Uncharacterized protein n=1 Tax=Podospora fimiseda TaxID=252190 RepID=A0AAN7H516_9PEZI|nr:hypothetical protein QBC38DRAFT_466500 [Podospora fimiseda]
MATEMRPRMSTRAGPVMDWWIAEQFESSYSQEEEDVPPSEPEIDSWDITVVVEDVGDYGEVIERRVAVEDSVKGDPELVSPLTSDGGSMVFFDQEGETHGGEVLGGADANSRMPPVPRVILSEQHDDLHESTLKPWTRKRPRSNSISSQRSSKSCTEQLVTLSLQGSLMTSRLSPTSGFSSRIYRSKSVSSMTRSVSPQEFEDGLIPVLSEEAPVAIGDPKRPGFWTKLKGSKSDGLGSEKKKRVKPSYY